MIEPNVGMDPAQLARMAPPAERSAEAPADTTAGTQEFKLFGDKGFSFLDVLDIVNPLQHIPVVSTIYRKITGDELSPGARIAGDTLYGGPIGAAIAMVDTAVEHKTGRDMGGNVLAALIGDEKVPPTNGTAFAAAAPDYIQGADPSKSPVNAPASALIPPPYVAAAVPDLGALDSFVTSGGTTNIGYSPAGADTAQQPVSLAPRVAVAAWQPPPAAPWTDPDSIGAQPTTVAAAWIDPDRAAPPATTAAAWVDPDRRAQVAQATSAPNRAMPTFATARATPAAPIASSIAAAQTEAIHALQAVQKTVPIAPMQIPAATAAAASSAAPNADAAAAAQLAKAQADVNHAAQTALELPGATDATPAPLATGAWRRVKPPAADIPKGASATLTHQATRAYVKSMAAANTNLPNTSAPAVNAADSAAASAPNDWIVEAMSSAMAKYEAGRRLQSGDPQPMQAVSR